MLIDLYICLMHVQYENTAKSCEISHLRYGISLKAVVMLPSQGASVQLGLCHQGTKRSRHEKGKSSLNFFFNCWMISHQHADMNFSKRGERSALEEIRSCFMKVFCLALG